MPYVSQQSSFAPGVPGQLSKGSVSGTTGSVEREETKEVGDVEKVEEDVWKSSNFYGIRIKL